MYLKKKRFILINIIIVSILACSCAKDSKNNIQNIKESENEISNHIEKQLQNNLNVNADIVIPSKETKYNIYTVREKVFDNKLFKSNIITEKIIEDELYEDGGEPIGKDKYTDANIITDEKGNGLSILGTLVYYTTPLYEDIYYSLKTEKNLEDYNLDKYSTTSQLEFMSREKAFNNVKKIMSNLKIDISEDYTCYSLDCKTLRKEEKFDSTDENETKEKRAWSKNDECYLFDMKLQYDKLPVTPCEHGNPDAGTYVNGTKIQVIYGKDGLVMLNVESIYETNDNDYKLKEIIDIETALDELNDKYNNIIITDPIEINQISLEYMAIKKSKDSIEYILTPVWIFDVKQTYSDRKEYYHVFINAVTGDEII